MTLARFMGWALYHPQWGYYTRGPHIGPRGDFTTSPEASPTFGAMLARHVTEVDALLGRPTPFHILECGPGQGTLARDILSTLQSEAPDVYRRAHYDMLEVSAALRDAQQSLLTRTHPGKVSWLSTLDKLDESIQGAVIANEFLDAFPVHALRNAGGELCEEYVALDDKGELSLVCGALSDPKLAHFIERYNIRLEEGEKIEVCQAAADWLRELGGRIERGVAVFLDYGDTQPNRYSPARREGTLLGYRGGSVTDDPLSHPGEGDLTALVDFTHMSDAAQGAGFNALGITRQATFLLGLGLGEGSASPLAQSSVESALQYRRGLQTLISMEGLGRFHVLVLSKGIDAEKTTASLSGLRFSSIL